VLDTGTFLSLDNQVDTQTGTVRAKATFNNANLQLFPSQFVNVQLNVRVVKDAIVVPVTALRHSGNSDFVFVLKDDRSVSQRTVTRGQATVDKVQVTSGLQAGERVITEGADRLRDGSRVILPGDNPQGGRGAGQGGGRRRASEETAPAPGSEGARVNAAPPAQGQASAQPRAQAPAQPRAQAPAAGLSDKPTPEQRQRMLDSAKDNPERLDRVNRFLAALDKGDSQAVERWHQMQQRRREGGGGGGQ
jgi:multidrug efflux system membrane fusion protein